MMRGCILGGLVVGLLLLHRLVGKREKKIARKAVENGGCKKDGSPDVVIVGAGVAGSALAYCLAKVCCL